MPHDRLKDWADVPVEDRAAACGLCCDVADAIQATLAPFIELRKACEPATHGPLAGLPYAAKDMFLVPGRTPTWGLAEPAKGLPEGKKADVLDLLDGAGACCMGFTRMTALAYEPSGFNPLQGAPSNPWNPDFMPGASSSGSAVAVASGAAFAALGSDTAGSLRIPAHCCGLTAWKPTLGMVPDGGAMPLSPSLDAIGLLARSARDIVRVAPILAPGLSQSNGSARPRKIAVLDDALKDSHSEIRHCCEEVLEIIGTLGAVLERRPRCNVVDDAGSEALTVLQAEAASAHSERLDDPAFDPMLARRLRKGLGIDAATLAISLDRRESLVAAFRQQLLGSADMVVLPVMPIRTPRLCETDPDSLSFDARTLYALSAYTRFVNFLGLPAVALPVGFDDRGMPVGLQLVGRSGSDMELLAAATWIQTLTDWHGRLPATLLAMRRHYGELLS